MLKKDVLAYFDPGKSRSYITAEKLGVSAGLISQWEPIIPKAWAYEIAVRSKGEVPFRPNLYKTTARRRRVAA